MIAKEAAAAELSLLHVRRWTKPNSTDEAPSTPAINANISMKFVEGFPPKSAGPKQVLFKRKRCHCSVFARSTRIRSAETERVRGWSCSPSMYLSRDHPARPRMMRYTTKLVASRGPTNLLPLPLAIVKRFSKLSLLPSDTTPNRAMNAHRGTGLCNLKLKVSLRATISAVKYLLKKDFLLVKPIKLLSMPAFINDPPDGLIGLVFRNKNASEACHDMQWLMLQLNIPFGIMKKYDRTEIWWRGGFKMPQSQQTRRKFLDSTFKCLSSACWEEIRWRRPKERRSGLRGWTWTLAYFLASSLLEKDSAISSLHISNSLTAGKA